MTTTTLNARDFPAAAYTVFFDRAEAKRDFTGIKVTKGVNEVVIENLPPTLNPQYLGVDGKGPAMIVDVRCSPQFAKPQDITGSESSQKLQGLEKRQKRLQSDIETLKAKEGVLRDVLVAYASSDGFDFETALDKFDEKKANARASLEVLQEELANVEQEIRQVGVGETHRYGALTGHTVKITIEADDTCEVSLCLTTLMSGVTFTPFYTLRASSSGSDNSLKIRYQARISNLTGEDWKEVALSISTAQASETTVIPQLQRWTVDFTDPSFIPKRVEKRAAFGASMQARSAPPQMAIMQPQAAHLYPGQAVGGYGGPGGVDYPSMFGQAESASEMMTAGTEVSEGITSTFIIQGKQTLKDGDKNHTVVIRDLVLEGKFANICVPKIKDVAYLQARVKNTTEYPLLAGEVALFLDGAFVGQTEFTYVSPGDFVNVCLGVDKGLSVKYHPRQAITSKRGMVLAKSTVQGYSQLISIRNLKSSPVAKLTVMDQIPISEDKSIVVNMIAPNKDTVINVVENVPASTAEKKGVSRMSFMEKGEQDKVLWNPDTGRLTWDFINVKDKKSIEIKMEWEVVSGDRTVHSHFGDKI